MTKHDDPPIDMVRMIAKDKFQPDSLEWRLKHENPERFDEFMKIFEKEGDEHEWTSKEDYKCKILRSHMGMWCGYVFIPKSHPMYGKNYDDVNVEVHGGLTFGEPSDEEWVLGFDCGHAGDFIPGMKEFILEKNSSGYQYPVNVYRDKEYVIKETNSLSEQLYKIKSES